MTFLTPVSAAVLPLCWLFVFAVDATNATAAATAAAAAAPVSGTNSSGLNSTLSGGRRSGGLLSGLDMDGSMIRRALYVLIGITGIGVLYFLIRAVRLKKPVQKKKYGLLSNYDDSVELDGGESEEDDTLYEARSLRR